MQFVERYWIGSHDCSQEIGPVEKIVENRAIPFRLRKKELTSGQDLNDPEISMTSIDNRLERITNKSARIGVIGLGYVGLPLAITAAKRGFSVCGFDVDEDKVRTLRAEESYIDAVSDADLVAAVSAERFTATTDFSGLKDCEAIIICVPTPLTRHREPDLSYVETTANVVAEHMSPGTLVVLESTTYPGTTRDVLKPILEATGKEVQIGFSPEREDPGNSSYRTATIPKIVAGEGAVAGQLIKTLYEGIVDKVVEVEDTPTAEAVKITENIFRAVNIALVNELKLIYDRMGIDVWKVIDGAATKPFGYMPFYPGPGLGGHCIPIDPFYLTWKAREVEAPTRFIELAGEINTAMPHHVVDRVAETLDTVCGLSLSRARVLVIGAAYKKNVADVRESPSMRLMELLAERGSKVEFFDPHVPVVPVMRMYPRLEGKASIDWTEDTLATFDIAVIATDHDLVDYEALVKAGIPIVDTRNAIERRGLEMTSVVKA